MSAQFHHGQQIPLFYGDARKATAQGFILAAPDCFREGFGRWLEDNWGIWLAFEKEALRVHAAGRTHYSANRVIEYLRHDTAMRDRDSEWKMDDRWVSSLARLFAMMNPRMSELFEFRERRDGVVRRAHQVAA